MFIIDFSNTMMSNLMIELGKGVVGEVDESLLRHMIIASLLRYNKKFKKRWGEMVIAMDGRRYWRKDVFPYYKANRSAAKDKSDLNWPKIMESLNKIRDEVIEYLPYKSILIDNAEADDIIGVLTKKYSLTEEVLIVSGDTDFKQLHVNSNVSQYNAVHDKPVKTDNAILDLQTMIFKGQGKDGVPNFLSQDDSYVLKIRQKSVFQKKIDEWVLQNPEDFCDETMLRRYNRNRILLDLSCTPTEIQDAIINSYNREFNNDKAKLFNYFIKNRLKLLMENLNEF